ncbi:5'/3'-nucleotidase SurE [Cellulosimicrobium sp. CUA-896]|uniref:5'/3'-nucleotidase SurE n=1 Tax=Cellulosimicrobium sp. CUA-896 TaxID=1517881 RepID=UPI00096422F3|nr:5'/3'-nucleotidase SurE [Cellulosimicrobium sp. CUA-896]OLT50979.1 5'/3'-nucleotidase SurE [Cellulosimicrobium sp. CUA-896]
MHALVTNDDGIDSPGLAVLAGAALDAGYDVTVAAPARESSGASASLLGAEHDGRLVVEPRRAPGLPEDVTSLAVRAAPALIAFVAAHRGFGPKPDLVLSGVNKGANTGNAILHSGTVGAALSATTHGITSVAVSVDAAEPRHWETARTVTDHVLGWVRENPLGGRTLNVNVPDCPRERLRGLRNAPLASFGLVQARIHENEDRDLMLQYAGTERHSEPESDTGLLTRGWATATLLRAPFAEHDVQVPDLV